MTKSRRTWVYSPRSLPKPKVPEAVKTEVQARADELIETFFKPHFIQPPPKKPRLNYITDIYAKWYRSFFYFCSTWRSPWPDAISPEFEIRFTRIEYAGKDRFHLAYMRHTGKWQQVHSNLSLEACFAAIRDNPIFHPA